MVHELSVTQIQTLKTENIDLKTKLQTSQRDIETLKHVEAHFIECGWFEQGNWSHGEIKFRKH
jgi:hypothetical protein